VKQAKKRDHKIMITDVAIRKVPVVYIPQFSQNFAPGTILLPQFGQNIFFSLPKSTVTTGF